MRLCWGRGSSQWGGSHAGGCLASTLCHCFPTGCCRALVQSRPDIFDLEIKAPDVLYEMVVECEEQVVLPLGDTPGT